MGLQWEKKIIQEYHGKLSFGDLVGRKNWINYLRFTLDPEADGGNCLLFIGEAHTGKKTLLRAAAGEWAVQGYEIYEVYGEELSRDKEVLREQIDTIYDKMTEGRKILLFYSLDKIKSREAGRMLAFGLEQISRNAENTTILATAQSAERLSERMLKLFTICPVGRFKEEELTEAMQAFLASCCPEGEEEQKKIREALKDRNCWELERIANLAVNYAVLELTDGQNKNMEEVQNLLEEEKLKVTFEQIQKAAEDIASVRWKKEPKEKKYVYMDRVFERPAVQENVAESSQSQKDEIIPDDKVTGLDGLGEKNLDESIEQATQVLEAGDPTEGEIMEQMEANGELEKPIDLSGIEVVD